MSKKVKIIEDINAPVGRGFVALKAGWSGTVKDEVYAFVMAAGAAEDVAKPKSKSKPSLGVETQVK